MSRIEDLEKRLTRDPDSKIFAQLAEEYRKAGRLDDAIAACRQGLQKHPNYPSARVALGRALLEKKAFEEAREEFEKVLEQVPDNILANKFLAETYHKLGRLEEALLKYGVAHTLAPEDQEITDRKNEVEDELTALSAPPPASAQDLGAGAEPYAPVDEEAEGAPPPLPDQPPTTTPPEFSPEGEIVFEFDTDESPPTAEAAEATLPGSGATVGEASEGQEQQQPPAPPPARAEAASPPSPEEEPSGSLAGTGTEETEATVRASSFPARESRRAPAPEAPGEKTERGVKTATLAELYASQGHFGEALQIYRELQVSQPNDPKTSRRVKELERLLQSSAELDPAELDSGLENEAMEATIRKLEGWLAAIRKS